MAAGWSKNGFLEGGRSIGRAGLLREGELEPLRNGLFVGRLTVNPGEGRRSVPRIMSVHPSTLTSSSHEEVRKLLDGVVSN